MHEVPNRYWHIPRSIIAVKPSSFISRIILRKADYEPDNGYKFRYVLCLHSMYTATEPELSGEINMKESIIRTRC
jgi:hypothetical protein